MKIKNSSKRPLLRAIFTGMFGDVNWVGRDEENSERQTQNRNRGGHGFGGK